MKTKHVQYTSTQHSTQVNKYNLKVDNQDKVWPPIANTILLQLPKTCFAVLVYIKDVKILSVLVLYTKKGFKYNKHCEASSW